VANGIHENNPFEVMLGGALPNAQRYLWLCCPRRHEGALATFSNLINR
jgi:hypothetical protein